MLKTWKSNLKKLSSKEYQMLRDMCHASKNVYNFSIYNIRQHYLQQEEYLDYESNYWLMKDTDTYAYLGNVSQQTMKAADSAFKAFFALMKMYRQGKLDQPPQVPGYLPKDGLYKLEFNSPRDQQKHIDQGFYVLPMSRYLNEKYSKAKISITVPEYIRSKRIKQIHILPRHKGRYFEICYIFEDEESIKPKLDNTRALSIDLGINNFATCATSDSDSFIIDGRKLKSINQWYNKELARLSSIKDHQHLGKQWTKQQYMIARKRNRRVQDYIYCSAKYIINYCIDHQIGNLVVGYNDGFQDNPNLGKVNNQKFKMLPFGQFKNRLEFLCKQNGMQFIKQEESYTSKASFFDNDEMPIWNKDNPTQGHFTGKRTYRGLYTTSTGQSLNADVNAALNILRKSNVVSLTALYSRGVVNTPIRIRLS